FRTDFSAIPGTESAEAANILERHGFADWAGNQAQVVFEAERGIDDQSVQNRIENLLADVDARLENVSIVSPYSAEGAYQVAPDSRIAFAVINFAERTGEEYRVAAEQIVEAVEAADVEGLRI